MKTHGNLSNAVLLELYRVALTNVESHPEIAQIMAEEGYDSETINAGKQLLEETRAICKKSTEEKEQKSSVMHEFNTKWSLLKKAYSKHRTKARLVFSKNKLVFDKLALHGYYRTSFVSWIERAEKFYTGIAADPELQAKLARMKIDEATVTECLAKLEDLKALKAVYQSGIGDAQQSTKARNAAMSTMRAWMYDFFTVARIALADKPQLLEALGKTVKS